MSEQAYMLLEALGQVIYEMEGIVDACNADETLAVAQSAYELRVRAGLLQRHLDRLDPDTDSEDEDEDN